MELLNNIFQFRKRNRGRKKSIVRILTITLTLAVVISSIIVFSIIYTVLSQKGYSQLEQKADEFKNALKGTLEMPLWNLDFNNIEKIGEAFTHNELFEKLRITDSAGGNDYYFFNRRTASSVVERSGEVSHNGRIIGRFEMALTTELYEKQNLQILYYGFILLLLTIIVLSVATAMTIRLLLNRLFYQTDMIADQYASENYGTPSNEMQYVEFQPLIKILGDLRDKLNARMHEVNEAEKKYRGIFENAVEGIFQTTLEGRFISANPALADMLGYSSPDELIDFTDDISTLVYVNPESRERLPGLLKEKGDLVNFQTDLYTKSGETIQVSINSQLVYGENGDLLFIEGMVQNITQQKKAEEEHERLKLQLIQSQKMESVGRLAGGIAHDFNNMLGIIMGYSELILKDLPEDDPNVDKIQEIRNAAERSADLTRQLLAFARKQAASPKVLNLNDTVSSMIKMLQRLLGEEIRLEWVPGYKVSSVKIDPGQIDQVLANLCINAKDAISGKGNITIETRNAVLDESFFANQLEGSPGNYVMISVSDDGCGMSPEVKDHVFEPFYTTKEKEKGTGLGLATVYGIVKQNNGSINVYSEQGRGTTIRIYLPVYAGEPDLLRVVDAGVSMGKGETVLLVEDEKLLLTLGEQMLLELGYSVITANSPLKAIEASDEHNKIDLLITDVIMPEINGRELSEKLLERYPGLKCIFMSGYTADVIAHQGVLEEGIHFIQKPFTRKELADKIRDVLSSN